MTWPGGGVARRLAAGEMGDAAHERSRTCFDADALLRHTAVRLDSRRHERRESSTVDDWSSSGRTNDSSADEPIGVPDERSSAGEGGAEEVGRAFVYETACRAFGIDSELAERIDRQPMSGGMALTDGDEPTGSRPFWRAWRPRDS